MSRRGLPAFQGLPTLLARGIKTAIGDLKKGDLLQYNQRLVQIDSLSSIQKGRGARTHLITAREVTPIGPDVPPPVTLQIRPTSGRELFDTIEAVDRSATFMYASNDEVYFMDSDTLEEIAVPIQFISPAIRLLLEAGEKVRIRKNKETNEPFAVWISTAIKCTVRGVTPQGSSCVVATVSGGRVVCPPIVAVGDRIAVDVNSGQYLSRV